MINKFIQLPTTHQIGDYIYSEKAILGGSSIGATFLGKNL